MGLETQKTGRLLKKQRARLLAAEKPACPIVRQGRS
jgi:hypothetical protein